MDIKEEVSKRLDQFSMMNNDAYCVNRDAQEKLNAKIRHFAETIVGERVEAENAKADIEVKMREVSPYLALANRMRLQGNNPVLHDFMRSLELVQTPVGNSERMLKVLYLIMKTLAEKMTGTDIFTILTEADKPNEKENDGVSADDGGGGDDDGEECGEHGGGFVPTGPLGQLIDR